MASKVAEYRLALESAKMKLEAVASRIKDLEQTHAVLARAVSGWEAILALEESSEQEVRSMNLSLPLQVASLQDDSPIVSTLPPDKEVEADGENKTQFVRDKIAARGSLGTTAKDLIRLAEEARMKHPPSWPYGPIQRLKKKGEIVKRRGRFYPKEASTSLALVG